jgi:hypothetical protein
MFCLLAGALLAQETNAVTKTEQKTLNRIAMRNARPQKKATVHVVAPRPLTLDKPGSMVPVYPVIMTPSAQPVNVATPPIPFQFSPLFEMTVIPCLINSPSPSFDMTVITSLINVPNPSFNMPSVASLIDSPRPSFKMPVIPSLISSTSPSFDMPSVASLIDSPKPVFIAGTANLLPAYRQSLVINKVLFTPQAIKKHAYEYSVMFREDVLEVYPMLLTRRAADQTYFGYLEFTISRALSEKNYELADRLAAQYQREWDRLKPTGTRIQRPR